MLPFVISSFRSLLPAQLRYELKRMRRRIANSWYGSRVAPLSLNKMEHFLRHTLGISSGDSLLISSSFGNLKAEFTPRDLIELLQKIVGPNGNLVMPFYPPGNSYEWAKSGQIFDMKKTRSSMGILTQVLSEMPETLKSCHPTKAVVAWGKNAETIVMGHESSTTPFFWDSPYGWLLKNPSKSLGLGLKHMPIIHALEDTLLPKKSWLYYSRKSLLPLRDESNNVRIIPTYVHDPKIIHTLDSSSNYIQRYNLTIYHIVRFGFSYCFVVNNQQLFEFCKNEFQKGNFRYKQ